MESPSTHLQPVNSPWSWESISPSSSLVFHPCYETLECARLSVPLDWQDPMDKRRAVLAILRRNATDTSNYLGPLFVNPGGPGGSAVEMVRDAGEAIQVSVGSNHDIIGIDPRGMGATLPSAHCWTNPQDEQLWDMQSGGSGGIGGGGALVDAYPGAIYDLYARQSLLNANCGSNMGEITKFAGTTSVARDMLAVLEELGGKKAMLRYWGLSYGTVIGGTFAAMFPERVERMVNDGMLIYLLSLFRNALSRIDCADA